VNAPSTEVRAAVPVAVACSSTRRHRACSSAVIAVASAAARYPIADRSISSASSALPGGTTLLIAASHLLPMLADRRADSLPGLHAPGSAGSSTGPISTIGRRHFRETHSC